MSFLPNTELARTEKQNNELDSVRVVGVSPIKQTSLAEWEGASGEFLIVTPLAGFGANQIVPLAALQDQYTVTSFPDEEEVELNALGTAPKRVDQRLTPEQQFSRAAKENTAGKKPKQAKPEPVTS